MLLHFLGLYNELYLLYDNEKAVDVMNNAVNIEDRNKTCCFTGHRPEKLGMEEENLKKLLRKEIRTAVKDGYTTFISGMAKGVDLIAARVVLEERKKNENIRLICASPYADFEKGWTDREKEEYRIIMEDADETKYICEHCFRGCYQIRNRWMVDNSSMVIAVFNGEKGGTKNTIDYALKKGVSIHNII